MRRAEFRFQGNEQVMSGDAHHVDALVERLRGGDREALGELFSLHRDRLKRMVEVRLDKRLRGRVSGSDVLQEAYIDAAKRVDHYLGREDMPFYIWLRMITGQRLVEVHREHLGAQRRDAGRETSINASAGPAASSVVLADRLAGHLTSPSHGAVRNETAARLNEMLDGMDELDREVLVLRHFEELGNNEVARILDIDKHAASKRYVRALKRLGKALSEIPGFRDEYERD